jgi:hypothetical protein
MGWDGCYDATPKTYREEIVAGLEKNGYKVLKTAATNYGRHLYIAIEEPVREGVEAKRSVLVTLIEKHGDMWMKKDMDEDMGPYMFDCPLSILALVPTVNSEHAAKWREGVYAHHARRTRTFAIGTKVKIGSTEYEVLGKRRRGYLVARVSDGKYFKANPEQMHPITS